MNEKQVRALLAVAMSYDNRKPGSANVAGWIQAANRERWDYAEAVEAIHAHYASSTEFVMPGHITQHLRQERRHPPRPHRTPESHQLDQAPPASHAHRAATMDRLRRDLGWANPEADHDRIRSVPCDYCGAAARKPCHQAGHPTQQISGYHDTRVDAATQDEP